MMNNSYDLDLYFESSDDTKDWRKEGAVTPVKNQVRLIVKAVIARERDFCGRLRTRSDCNRMCTPILDQYHTVVMITIIIIMMIMIIITRANARP